MSETDRIDTYLHEARGWIAEYQRTREALDLDRALAAIASASGLAYSR